jgi:hypothetical protein
MHVFVSPYHLTTREPPAMAALLLADDVTTLSPAPLGSFGKEDLRRLTERSPRYLRFVETWAWSMPFWKAGVLGCALAGEDAAPDVRRARELIDREEDLAPLRPLVNASLIDDDVEYLDALAGDLLKGGPDPGVSVPLAAGIDRFATRHEMMVARSEAFSIAQRAEERLGRRVFAVAVPVLAEASADVLLDARERLKPELARLRIAIESAIGGDPSDLAPAGAAYAAAFERELPLLREGEQQRTVPAMVTLTGLELPTDAALRSSAAAAGVLGLAPRAAKPAKSSALALSDPLRNGRFVALVVKVIGARRTG